MYVLEKEIKTINDVTFIGGTLWTDMNNGDSLTLYHMKGMMNDFRVVDNSHRKVSFKTFETVDGVENRNKPTFRERVARLSPEDVFEDHVKMKGYIQQIIEGKPDQKFVVCGHHSPSKKSTHPMYERDTIMNGGYSSDLDEFIVDHPQIKLWTHGHTHHVFDYMVGDTRIVCNPRGYVGHEQRAIDFELLTVEV
jgi:hypothetical protein